MAPRSSKNSVRFDQLCKEIDRFEIKIKECPHNDSTRFSVLKKKLKSYEDQLSGIFSNLSQIESDEYFEMYLEFQDKLLNMSVDLESKMVETQRLNCVNNIQNLPEPKLSPSLINLPKFDLPHFYGESEAWISFKELFKSSIMDNKSLSDLEKLHYLQTAVRGKAAKIIRGFSLQGENLKHCWELLNQRYENKRQLALSQLNKIFSIKVNKANNAKSLLELLDTCNEIIRNLKSLGLESNALSDLMFIQFMLAKLDYPLKHRWELTFKDEEMPAFDSFRKFIEVEARSLTDERNKFETKVITEKKPLSFGAARKHLVNNSIIKKGYTCIVCNQIHALFKCPDFKRMPVKERWKVVEVNKLCENCLRQNHTIESCRINVNCANCSLRHHTLLHIYAPNTENKEASNLIQEASISNATQCYSSKVLLSTALINVKGKEGRIIQCKALVDNGSQSSLISVECSERLNLPLHSTSHSLIGVNCMLAETALKTTEFEFTPHFSSDSFTVNAFVVDRVTSPLPNFLLSRHEWPHIKGLTLSDPQFFIPGTIDILLGADTFSRILCGSPVVGPSGTPTAIPSRLGWILSGHVDNPIHAQSSVVCHTLSQNKDEKLNKLFKNFINLENLPKSELNIESNDYCEEFFKNTTKRNSEGKYIVKLPFHEDKLLGDTRSGALNRFYSLEKKLCSNSNLKDYYVNFMREYIQLNHMSPLNPDEISSEPNFYLPHHGVVNSHSTTTRLRVVYDASFRSSNNKSLNDVLLKGPKLQNNIFNILIQFRCYPVAFTADIAKMYRQILVAEEDRQYQRIYWRESPTEPMIQYKLNTITYGTACAPYLAIRTLKKLCDDEFTKFPLASEIAREQFYVDDLLAGGETIESAKILIKELQNLMDSGGFPLRKWACSHPEALSELDESLKADSVTHYFCEEECSQRVLGVFWHLKSDCLQVRTVEQERVTTKRQLLSQIARTYDPLGLISPATVILKILLQALWKAKLDWDELIPPDILERWLRFQSELPYLGDVRIPRYVYVANATKIEICGFCDASSKAYAAVVYLRVHADTIYVSLIASKTRVAPVAHVTLPRLELSGALLLAELVVAIESSVKFTINQTFLWCDSTITLGWIHKPPSTGNQFVTHRVEKIRSLTHIQSWRHIPGKENPADVASRGLFPKQLQESSWFTGPKWLHENSEFNSYVWERTIPEVEEQLEQEDVSLVVQTASFPEFLNKYSSYLKLLRVLSWILRFHNNCKSSKVKGPLTAQELNNSKYKIVKLIQATEFPEDIKQLSNKKPLTKNSKLLSLNVFLDSNNILRVGGRLCKHPTLHFDQKYPMLIPKNHHFTSLVITHFHKESFHGGNQLVLSLIRQQFWIPDGRSQVRKELRNCLKCFRFTAQPVNQLMGNLPESRITPNRPFEKVGVDYAGPFFTKCQHKRKASTFKSYICLFICMCSKAVHLELVSTLSTEGFLSSLQRFISRRGYPTDIYSDNGRNFIGANSYLKTLINISQNAAIQDFSSAKAISWHFTPPYAPNFGGLWEASVKLAKRHLLKVCQGTLFNFEELSTLLCQVEACINSRPLVPLSSDTKDSRALTPGHFLIGTPLIELPEPNSDNISTNTSLSLSSRFQLILKAKNLFWKRWTLEYLHSLMSRPRHNRAAKRIQVGDLAVLVDKSTPPLQWKLCRIAKLHPGQDEVTRVVDVITAAGKFSRPVTRLAILPVDSARPQYVSSPPMNCE